MKVQLAGMARRQSGCGVSSEEAILGLARESDKVHGKPLPSDDLRTFVRDHSRCPIARAAISDSSKLSSLFICLGLSP